MLLIGSKTKAVLKGYGVNVSGDALDGLNNIVYWYLDQAAKRAQANGRKTIRAHDFLA
jgi:histone H3/H4